MMAEIIEFVKIWLTVFVVCVAAGTVYYTAKDIWKNGW